MRNARFKTCFISAPFGAETSALRRILAEEGIRWFDHTTIEIGSNLLGAISSALAKSDFVCAVLQGGEPSSVLFEVGYACAEKKPILVFVDPSSMPPTEFASLVYVRADIKDTNAVRSAIRTFSQHATEKRPRISRPRSRGSKSGQQEHLNSVHRTVGEDFERRTAALFRDAGLIVSSPAERRARGADLAVWIDEFQHSLGNPLLVQVKSGSLSPMLIEEATSQLRRSTAEIHGRSALLVYWDDRSREFPPGPVGFPPVFQLSGHTLTRLVKKGRLLEELYRLRNAAVHGEV